MNIFFAVTLERLIFTVCLTKNVVFWPALDIMNAAPLAQIIREIWSDVFVNLKRKQMHMHEITF